MKNATYWIALQDILGYGSKNISDVLNKFDDVNELFEKTVTRKDLDFLTDKKYENLKKYNFKKAELVIKYCNENNIEIITLDDDKYPTILKKINNPPAVLYSRGVFPNFDDEVGITMVGTRNATLNGMIVAATLAYRIAQAGGLVISGGALGIDTKCTQGALYAKKPSVIVRPCGIDYNYLNSLSDVREKVEKCGAVISEIQPCAGVGKYAFQIRNRILAALSLGTIAIEVPSRSGASITVNYALDYGRDVFSIPGDIGSKNYIGSNKLIQDGAKLVYSAYDVLNEYLFTYPHKLNLTNAGVPLNEDDIYLRLQKKYKFKKPNEKGNDKKTKKSIIDVVKNKLTNTRKKEDIIKNETKIKKLNYDADKGVKLVFDCFPINEPCSLEFLIEKSKLSASDVMFALTDLEINNAIIALPGGRYEIK